MYKKIAPILLFVLALSLAGCFETKKDDVTPPQDMLSFLSKLETMQESERNNYIQRYFPAVQSKTTFPIISGKNVTFFYKGNLTDVGVVGDAVGGWPDYGASSIPLKNISGTDIYYRTIEYETDTKLEYQFFSNSVGQFLDERNKNVTSNEFANNEFIMPNYKWHEELNTNLSIPHGTVKKDTIKCDYYDNYGDKYTEANREFSVYLPPGYSTNSAIQKYKVVYFQDGASYVGEGKIPNILDSMIAKKEIEPVVAVFINYVNGNRKADYVNKTKSNYADFFATTFLSKIETEYNVRNDADGRIVVGESNSGSFAVYLAYKYPEKFKNILSNSGAFYAGMYDYWEEIEKANYPVKIYMISGLYELWAPVNKAFYDTLKKNRGVLAVKYTRYNMSHCFGLWRDTIRDGLLWLNDTNSKTEVKKNNNDKIISLTIGWKKNSYESPYTNSKYYVTLQKSVETNMLNAIKRQNDSNSFTQVDYYREVIPEKTEHLEIPVKVDVPVSYKLFIFCDVNGNGKYDSIQDVKISSNEHFLNRIILDAEDTVQPEFVTGNY